MRMSTLWMWCWQTVTFECVFQADIYEDVRIVDKVPVSHVTFQSVLHKGHFTDIKLAQVDNLAGWGGEGHVVAKVLKSELMVCGMLMS